jgi:hypothetical protein
LGAVVLPLGLHIQWSLKASANDTDVGEWMVLEVVWNMEGGKERRRMTSMCKSFDGFSVLLRDERMIAMGATE